MHTYSLYGFDLQSSVSFPTLMSSNAAPKAPLLFQIAPFSHSLFPDVVAMQNSKLYERVELADDLLYLIHKEQNQILAYSDNLEAVLSTLLNIPFAAFFYYRDTFLLHSCTVESEGKLICFCGEKGAGKSTTLLYFLKYYSFYSDDTLLLKEGKTGGLEGIKGGSFFKATRETVHTFFPDKVFDNAPKNIVGKAYLFPEKFGAVVSSVHRAPINKIFFIRRSRTVKNITIQRIDNAMLRRIYLISSIVGINYFDQHRIHEISQMNPFLHLLRIEDIYLLLMPNDLSVYNNDALYQAVRTITEHE